MSLFTPAWKGENDEKALAKINKIKNPNVLLRIALDTEIPLERSLAAINRMENNDDLYEVVYAFKSRYNKRKSLAVAAAKRMTDQKKLAGIVKDKSMYGDIRESAAERITDQKMLIHLLAEEGIIVSVLNICAKNINDQAELIRIAKTELPGAYGAFDNISTQDESVWMDIASNAKKYNVRRDAVRKLTDAKYLMRLLRNTKLKETAYARMKELRLLDEAAVKIMYPRISKESVKWILEHRDSDEPPAEVQVNELLRELRKDGYDPGIFDTLRKIYDKNPNLRKLILDNTKGYRVPHYDQDLCWGEHNDTPAHPAVFGR